MYVQFDISPDQFDKMSEEDYGVINSLLNLGTERLLLLVASMTSEDKKLWAE